jgi:hypothetical protein
MDAKSGRLLVRSLYKKTYVKDQQTDFRKITYADKNRAYRSEIVDGGYKKLVANT